MSGARIGFRNGTLFWLAAVLLAAALPAKAKSISGSPHPGRAPDQAGRKPDRGLPDPQQRRRADPDQGLRGKLDDPRRRDGRLHRRDANDVFQQGLDRHQSPGFPDESGRDEIRPLHDRRSPGTPPGGYHSAISFETVPDASAARAGNRMLFTGKIAAAVYVIAGRPAVEGDLVDFTLGEKRPAGLPHVGGKHRPDALPDPGTIRAFAASGEKLFDLEIPDDVLLPESRKNIACPLPGRSTRILPRRLRSRHRPAGAPGNGKKHRGDQ